MLYAECDPINESVLYSRNNRIFVIIVNWMLIVAITIVTNNSGSGMVNNITLCSSSTFSITTSWGIVNVIQFIFLSIIVVKLES